MGNAGVCSAFCSDLQKSAPLVQYLAENPPCCSEDLAGRFHLQSQGFVADVRTDCQDPAPMPSPPAFLAVRPEVAMTTTVVRTDCQDKAHMPPSFPSVHPEAAMTAVAALEREATMPPPPSLPSVRPEGAMASVAALDQEPKTPDTIRSTRSIQPPSSGRQSVAASSDAGSDIAPTISATASDSTAATFTPDAGQAREVVKKFVRAYVKGRDVSVLSIDGGVKQCFVTLDRKLTSLSLQRSGKKESKKRVILLEDITQICVGLEAKDDVDLELDELCVTMLFGDGQAVGFRLEDIEERDTFALCMAMFVDGRRGEVKKRRKSKIGGA